MLLTVSKRLEFSASRRLFVQSWSAGQNRAVFGPETSARYGTGRNYVAFFVFSGNVNPKTGMLVNISEIKKRVGAVLHAKFDRVRRRNHRSKLWVRLLRRAPDHVAKFDPGRERQAVWDCGFATRPRTS